MATGSCWEMAGGHSCCEVEKSPQAGCAHEAMAGMQMIDIQMPHSMNHETRSDVSTAYAATCDLCINHSPLRVWFNSLQEADQARSLENVTAPPPLDDQVVVARSFVLTVCSNHHTPRGATRPLHVIFNNLRI